MSAVHPSGAQRTVVILAAGLSPRHLNSHMPSVREFVQLQGGARTLRPSFPAVTCTSQADLLTGQPPRHHGVVANGWMDRQAGEVRLWRQSNQLVRGPMVWERARERFPGMTVANLFGWFNMCSSADFMVTPRPQYGADGRKVPDILTTPASLRDRLQAELGAFPLFHFWGPRADIRSSEWIAQATQRVMKWHDPALTITYVPHLDYMLQREGPDGSHVPQELRELDRVLATLLRACSDRGAKVILCSEYGVTAATQVVYPNRALQQAGLLATRREFGGDALDLQNSTAFAMCDHQISHVYTQHDRATAAAKEVLQSLPGVQRVLEQHELASVELDHARSGDLVLVPKPGAWFAYPWWSHESDAPDFAQTVDIHRKPGFDPCELLTDCTGSQAVMRVAMFRLRKVLGFRSMLRLTPLDATLVKGTHGLAETESGLEPLLVADGSLLPDHTHFPLRSVHDVILRHLSGAHY